jgi:hypothetical protein
MARIIALANQKGGVAKTSSTINLGAALAELQRRVLLVDLDPQILVATAGLHVAPAPIDLAAAEIHLLNEIGREQVLADALADVADMFDDILIDCPPSLGQLTINALTAAVRDDALSYTEARSRVRALLAPAAVALPADQVSLRRDSHDRHPDGVHAPAAAAEPQTPPAQASTTQDRRPAGEDAPAAADSALVLNARARGAGRAEQQAGAVARESSPPGAGGLEVLAPIA